MCSRMMGNANEHATTYIYDTVAVQGTISIDLNGITYAFALATTSAWADTDMHCSGQMETLGVYYPSAIHGIISNSNDFRQVYIKTGVHNAKDPIEKYLETRNLKIVSENCHNHPFI